MECLALETLQIGCTQRHHELLHATATESAELLEVSTFTFFCLSFAEIISKGQQLGLESANVGC